MRGLNETSIVQKEATVSDTKPYGVLSVADLAWAHAVIDAVFEDAKKRLAALKSDRAAYGRVVLAVVLVASRKAGAYERARAGLVDTWKGVDGWVVEDPELASACLELAGRGIGMGEIGMRVMEGGSPSGGDDELSAADDAQATLGF
jgi:hypothetical protein